MPKPKPEPKAPTGWASNKSIDCPANFTRISGMKLLYRGLLAGVCLAASLFFSGCQDVMSPDTDLLQKQPLAPIDVARFRVGQTVTVSFSGAGDNTIPPHEEVIKEDGTITLPLIGPVVAVGKTAGELQTEIHDLYVPQYYVRLTVTVKAGDRVFYVGGEVGHSGVYQYIADTTVTKAIQAAGGLTPFASHTHIWLIHSGTSQRIQVNYDEAIKNPSKDPPVYPDDQLTVDRSPW